MSDKEQLRREEIRRAVRAHLVERPGLSQGPSTIRLSLRHTILNVTIDEVNAAITFLVSLRHLEVVKEPLGATEYFRATAEGTLAHERGQ